MLGLRALFAAIARVTAAINGIATTAEEVNARWRDQLHLDADEVPPLEIDMAGKASGVPQDATTTADAPTARNGRRRGATA
jgi:hypothetical protein